MTVTARATSIPLWVIATVCGCLACAGDPPATPASPEPARSKPAAHRLRPLPRAVLPDGFAVTLELAQSPEEISQGLMFRASLAEDRGMLFLFEEPRMPSFWMKNTLIPLDIVFLDGDGTVVDVAHDARPCPAEPCPHYVSARPALATLELAAGSARAHGIVAGARIRFERVPGYPLTAGEG
jgi:uncharacterized membrane protein (UPF0127 family)